MEEDTQAAGISRISRILNSLKQYKILIIILGFIMALFCVLILSLTLYTWDKGQIAKGVVLEIPLGGLDMDEAHWELEQMRKEIYTRPVHFFSDEGSILIDMEELGLICTYDQALQQAYLIGREGNLFHKAIRKHKASWGIAFKPEYQWSDLALTNALTKHLSTLNSPAEDAHFLIAPDNTLQIGSEKLGKQVDINSLIASIKKLNLSKPEMIPIPLNTVSPIITRSELENAKPTRLLSSYTTHFDPNLKERSHNIRLAAKAIEGRLLKPGEEFSFNQTVGARTIEAGYQTAIIIEGNKFVPGLGGGVCQVSSTLYNAVQLASLKVIERSRHSLMVSYVPLGQDATVAYPSLDFKFRNDSNGYLLIRSLCTNNTVAFSIYGK